MSAVVTAVGRAGQAQRLKERDVALAPRFLERAGLAAGLCGVFCVIYGGCLYLTSLRANVPSLYFEWERRIPFVQWMIVPYMSIDLFFVGAFFVCRGRDELRAVAKRLVMALLVAGVCFLLFPLRYAFATPELHGWAGELIRSFKGMDRPFNLAPSLHIAFRTILWVVYVRHTRGVVRAGVKGWFLLIGLSTLLVFQHHVIDVFSGQLLGMFCIYLLPEGKRVGPVALPRPELAGAYGGGAAACAAVGAIVGGWGWLMVWPAVSLVIVAYGYASGRDVFRKGAGGRLPTSTWVVLWPYLFGLRLAWRVQRWRTAKFSALVPGAWIGGRPRSREWKRLAEAGVGAVVDLTAELAAGPLPHGVVYHCVAIPDLMLPRLETLGRAVETIRLARRRGVYVHCALGYGRTAVVAAAYLMAEECADSVEDAIAQVRGCRQGCIFTNASRQLLAQFGASLGQPACETASGRGSAFEFEPVTV